MSDHDEVRAVRELRAAVERLPREVRPARDLWPEIAGRLDERPRDQSAAGWWRLAAAVVLMAGGLFAATNLAPEARSPLLPVAAVAEAGSAMAAAHLRQRDGVLHAHNDLIAVAAQRRGRLDAVGAAALVAGLADLERATAEIEAALADSPRDRRLRLALAAAYRREAGWTSRLARV